MSSIEAILAEASPPEVTEAVCVNGALNAEVGRLQREIDALGSDWSPVSMSERDPRGDLEAALAEAKAAMSAATRLFRFRALPPVEWDALRGEHKSPEGSPEPWSASFPAACVAACAVDPVMTAEQAADLFARLGSGAADALFTAAWNVNTARLQVPYYGESSGARQVPGQS